MDIIQISDGLILITWDLLICTVVLVGTVGFIAGVFCAVVDNIIWGVT